MLSEPNFLPRNFGTQRLTLSIVFTLIFLDDGTVWAFICYKLIIERLDCVFLSL